MGMHHYWGITTEAESNCRGCNRPAIASLQSCNMHMTRFCDLKFRLGAGYLYCHQVPFSVTIGCMILRKKKHFVFFVLFLQYAALVKEMAS